jgi:hypothetical protein
MWEMEPRLILADPVDETAPDAPGRRAGSTIRRLRARRALVLAALIAALEAVTFGLYFMGLSVPPWDFFGSYNTDAYLWWSRGGFFDPVDWIPTLWAGYPAAAVLQNSAWYLPVGIAAAFGPFTLHSAAVVQAFHVAFGAIGAYLLIRRMGGSFPPALLAAAAWFFAVGIYSNAEHVDIVRGYAWLPWLLLVISPLWSWRRWWAIPAATVLLWQAATGVYPGILIAAAYVLPIWAVAAFFIWRRPVAPTVIGIAVSALGAVLLSGPRLLPFLMQSTATAMTPDASQFSVWILGTAAFGYGSPELPNDISMRSFFVPATVMVLACFAPWRSRFTRAAAAIIVPSFCLGMPFLPWFDAAQALPGMSLSRFSMSDFKPFLILGILLLGVAGAYAVARAVARGRLPRAGLVTAVVLLGALALLGLLGPFSFLDWVPPLALAALVLLGVVVAVRRPSRRRIRTVSVAIALTAVSGLMWSAITAETWQTWRAVSERHRYGSTVDELIASAGADTGERRPGREAPGSEWTADELESRTWNGAAYANDLAVGGNVNLRATATIGTLSDALDPATDGSGDVMDFLAASGRLVTSTGAPVGRAELGSCGRDGSDCGPAMATPDGYRPGASSFSVSTPRPLTAVLNEAYYPGWNAQACDGECAAIPVGASPEGLVEMALPPGDYRLSIEYRTPGRAVGWLLFGLGATLCLVATAGIAFVRRRTMAAGGTAAP